MTGTGVTSTLQLKAGQRVTLIAMPDDVELGIETGSLHDDPTTADAVIAFVTRADQLDERVADAVATALDDRLGWVAYPNGPRLGTDLNRDTLAAALMARGVQPVRQVAIDDVWSALRSRPASS